jgi:MFS family permease
VSFFTKSLSAPVLSLIFARVLYAVNWFNISSIFYLILIDFSQDVSMLGLVTASFLLGIGIFQVPAGILAAKYDPKKIAAFGIMMLSISSLLSGLATELFQIAVLRFLVGVGMAFFFGPSVILISAYLGKGSDGLGVGILNSAHSLGGIIGLFGWIVIAQNVGWRASLIVSGILGIMTGLFLVYELKQKRQQRQQPDENKDNGHQHPLHNDVKLGANDEEHGTQQPDFKIKLSDLRLVLINKQMIIVGLSLLGIQIGWNLVSTFVVLYLKNDLHVNPYFAGMVAGLAMVFNVVFAPIFGRIYDKTTKRRNRNLGLILLIACGVVVSVNIALFSLENIYVIVLSIIMIGIFISGGFVVPYTKAREIAIIKLDQRHYETLAVSFVNGLSLFGAFWVPFVFSIIVLYFGYPTAWLIGGFLTILFIIPVVKLAV